MIKALTNRHYYLRFAFSLLLLAFTGCKIVTPVYVLVKVAFKEIASTPDTDNDKMEECADPGHAFEKSPELMVAHNHVVTFWRGYMCITHFTAYNNHYQTGNYLDITGPPPDFYLHTSV